MAGYSFDHDPAGWRDPRGPQTDDVPRWLIVVGAIACVALTLALLRYAIDLLGLVFVIVLAGFSIRALTDWLTDRDSVSVGSIAAVFVGLFGTMAVGMWLFGSSASRAAGRLEQQLPPVMLDAISWAEARGWGSRVLLAPPAPVARGQDVPARGSPVERARGARGTPPAGRDRASGNSPREVRPPPAGERVEQGTRSGEVTAPAAPTDGPYNTSTTLSVPREVRAGARVGLRAVVSSEPQGSPAPEGTVIFWRDTVALGSAPLESDGPARAVARLTTVAVPAGTYDLLAEFAGNRRFRTSRSEIVQQLVTTQ